MHLVGGHTGGLQIVRVHTSRGAVVLASDAVHYWMNLAEQNPFPPANVMDALEAFRIVEDLAETATTSFPATTPWCSAASRRCAAISISCVSI